MSNQMAVPGVMTDTSAASLEAVDEEVRRAQKRHWILRPCLWVAFGIKWLPVLFILGVISWSYYAFVFALCVYTIEATSEKVLLLLFYHIILALFVSSYLRTIFAPTCTAPPSWRLSSAMVDRLSKAKSEEDWKNLLELFVVEMELSVMQRSVQGAIRYCDECQAIKPDRSHHCSACKSCILKMDHHCPWVNNCVAFNNYKFFILFLGYAILYCGYCAACDVRYFVQFWSGGLLPEGSSRFHILFLFFVALIFMISLLALFGYHIYLIAMNVSTLEQLRPPIFSSGVTDKHGWSLGTYKNFQEVFGQSKLLWLLPVHSAIGDGLSFPTRIHASSTVVSYQAVGNSPPPGVHVRRSVSQTMRSTELVFDCEERVKIKLRAQ